MWAWATIAVIILCSARPAEAEKRVILLPVEGRGGVIVKDAIDEVIQRTATVISSAAFQRARQAANINELSDGGYGTIALALGAEAIVMGTWHSVRTTWILRLYVRNGTTGEIAAELAITLPGPMMDARAKNAIAAKLLPTLKLLDADSKRLVVVGLRPLGADGTADLTRLAEAQQLRESAEAALREILGPLVSGHTEISQVLGPRYLVRWFDCAGELGCVVRALAQLRKAGVDTAVTGEYVREGDTYKVRWIVFSIVTGKVIGEVATKVPVSSAKEPASWRAGATSIIASARLQKPTASCKNDGQPCTAEPEGQTVGTTDGTSDPAKETPDGSTPSTEPTVSSGSDPAIAEDGTSDPAKETPDGSTPSTEPTVSSGSDPAIAESTEEAGGIGAISGKTFAYARAPLDGNPFQQVSASLWMSARPRFTDRTTAQIEITLDRLEVAATEQPDIRFTLREAFVSMKQGGWLLRVGQQIIPWGSSDGVNPIDFLSARDYRMFFADDEQTRIGAWSAMASRATTKTETTLIVTPTHPVTRLLIPAAVIPAGVTIADPTQTPVELRNVEVAGKLKYSGAGWDIAIVGFRGFNHTPELQLVSVDAGNVVVGQINRRINAGGLDGSVVFGKTIFRLETTYIRTPNRGDDPTTLPSHVYGVVGLERPFGDHVRAQIQGVLRWFPEWTSPASATSPDPELAAIVPALAGANALLQDYQDQTRGAATFRLAYGGNGEKFEAEVFSVLNFVGLDYLVRPVLGWNPTDAVKLQVGLEGYYGSRLRPLGSLYGFGGVFTQAMFAF